MIENFKEILLKVEKKADDDFSGIGIVLYSEIKGIPIFPLHNYSFEAEDDVLVSTFVEISKLSNPFHDGFHLISSSLKLTHTSQYFSPSIVPGIEVDRARVAVGGRYMAALFGSCIQNILLTGIVTKSNGVVIFKNGMEVFSKERK
ncbi:MAG: hypothetical protein COA74_15875 [Gammaproteobacteria bacterium]|nr:MAG: hypothetical protein COA74_15875 [Gammaproteobacteria bacterium]